LHKRKAPFWRLSGDGSDLIHKPMLGLVGLIIANQSSLQREVSMQERHSCWLPYFFPRSFSGLPTFFILESLLDAILREVQSSQPALLSEHLHGEPRACGCGIGNLRIRLNKTVPRRGCVWGLVHYWYVLMRAFLYVSCTCARAWLHARWLHCRKMTGWAIVIASINNGCKLELLG